MDDEYMKIAIEMAKKAAKEDEVPIGAVVVSNGRVVAKAYNMKERYNSSAYHAELIALKKAAEELKRWRLTDCTVYVTLEPCAMCAGAMLNYRVGRVVFGAYDKRMGCLGTVLDLSDVEGFNHSFEVKGGVCESECADLLSEYFSKKRALKKQKNLL